MTLIYQLPCDVGLSLEEKVLPLLPQIVCAFLKRGLLLATRARKPELENA